MTSTEAINVLKARNILKALEEVTEIDYCCLYESELVAIIARKLEEHSEVTK